MNADEVRTIPLFDAVPAARLAEAAGRAERVAVRAGEVLIRQGDPADRFFAILGGEAGVIRDDRLVAVLRAGDFFGEIELTGRPLSIATVAARSPLDLAILPRHEFRALLSRFPELAYLVVDTARRRLGVSRETSFGMARAASW